MTEQTRMLLTLKQIKPGMRVTLVSKGIINSFNNSYVDPTRIGYTSFLQVTNVGKQYLSGKHIYYDQGEEKLTAWQDKIDPEKYVIFSGIHLDLEQKYKDYRKALQEHEDKRKFARYNFEREAADFVRLQMEKWDKENPEPQPTDLNKLTFQAPILKSREQ
jgi:hypothetical protein